MLVHKLITLILPFLFITHMAFSQSDEMDIVTAPDMDRHQQVTLYPRPATTFLAVAFQEPHAKKVTLTIRSLIGNVIPVDKEYTTPYEIRLKVRRLPPGYYFISINNEANGSHFIYRFLKR